MIHLTTDGEYTTVLNKLEAGEELTPNEKAIAEKLRSEIGSRGNRARRASGQTTQSWGILGG